MIDYSSVTELECAPHTSSSNNEENHDPGSSHRHADPEVVDVDQMLDRFTVTSDTARDKPTGEYPHRVTS